MVQLYWILGLVLVAFIIKGILLLFPFYRLLSEEPTVFPKDDPRNEAVNSSKEKQP